MKHIGPIALLALAIIGLSGSISFYNSALYLGTGVGEKSGTIVGNCIGSYEGITTGLANGANDGKEEGLSAKDTKSAIKKNFSEIGNLEVLEAGVTLNNFNKVGKDYAALFLKKGVVVFSVNLKDVEINDIDEDTVEVLLPKVGEKLYIDEASTEKLAEYQKHIWSGSAENGLTEYMNSSDAMNQSVENTIDNYSALSETAQSAAIKRIEMIARSATGNQKEVVVRFKEEGQAEGS